MNTTFQRMALIKRISDIVKDAEAATKEALTDEMEPGDRKRVAIDGVQVATISRAEHKTTLAPVITSEAALIGWMKANGHEDAVVVRETIPDWWITGELAEITATGELPNGVDITEKTTGGYVSVRMTADQKAALDHILASGGLASLLADLPQITEGAEP